MPDRFYLESDGSVSVASPDFDPGWTDTSLVQRFPLSLVSGGSSITELTYDVPSPQAAQNILLANFISDPLNIPLYVSPRIFLTGGICRTMVDGPFIGPTRTFQILMIWKVFVEGDTATFDKGAWTGFNDNYISPAFSLSHPMTVVSQAVAPYRFHPSGVHTGPAGEWHYTGLNDNFVRNYPDAYGGSNASDTKLWLFPGDRLSVEMGIQVSNSSFGEFTAHIEIGSGAGQDLDQTLPTVSPLPDGYYVPGNPWFEFVDAGQASNRFSWQVSES